MKKIACFLLISILFVSCKSTKSSVNGSKKVPELCEQLVKNAKTNIGSPYKYAGTTKAGFDCSGLMFTTFKNVNINLPRTSFEMSKQGTLVDKNDSQKGDLIFFKTNGSSKINHVGLIVEVNQEDIKFIHSSTSKGVIISSLNESYYKKSFSFIRRIVE